MPHSPTLTRRALLQAAGTLGVLSPLLAACGTAGGAHRGDPEALTFGIASYPASMDPYADNGQDARIVNMAIHRGLFFYDPAGTLQPALLETHEQLDERTYRFVLREDLTFHDGSPVTAADVEASLRHIAAEDSGAKLTAQLANLAGLEVVDERQLVMRLSAPDATILQVLGNPQAPVVPAATIRDPDRNKPWPGAGPFRLAETNRGIAVTVEAFKDYYLPDKPRTRELTFQVYTDDRLRLTSLQTGEADIISYVPREDAKRIQADPTLVLDTAKGPFMYLTFNCERGPFTDPRVRQAVAYAVNREAVVEAALFGQGSPLRGMPVPQLSELANEQLANHWSYDPERARSLLAEAGMGGGFEATMLSSSQYTFHRDTALVVQANLADVGIRLNLDLPDWATRIDKGNAGQYDIGVQGSSGAFNDPAALSKFLRGPDSYVRSYKFSDEHLNALLDQGQRLTDQAARQKVYDQLITRALDQVPIVGLAWRIEAYAYRQSVTGFQSLPGFLQFNSAYTLENIDITDV